jgi:oligopeptide transport system permease protein
MNSEKPELTAIPAEKFQFVQMDQKLHDKAPETKPVGYFQDAMRRFARNRGSVVCAFIIALLVVYAIFAPIFSKYGPSTKDAYYSYALPKLSTNFDLGFWNGCTTMDLNQQSYDYYANIPGAVTEVLDVYEQSTAGRLQTMYKVRVDSYRKVGYTYVLLSPAEYQEVLDYQEETGTQLLWPMIDDDQVNNRAYQSDANAWFLTNQKGVAQLDNDGNVQNIYLTDETSDDGYAYYISKADGAQLQVRVLYYDWYQYQNGYEPCFVFGADEYGYNIFSRLATGARLSLTLSVSAALVNLILGIIVGALEGYYGGVFDLIFERVKDVLYQVPSLVFMTLFQIYFAKKVGALASMFFCFIFYGWISTSGTVRAQFYRFKGQEYVMAARTLGAKDRRLIFRHILPNAAGFIITASVLSIPGIIFSEATFSYLGIVNLQSSTLTSVGTMLENGQATLSTYPHCVFFPAAFLSLLLICFNIFGNGLRDAFNPSLRGTED